MKFSQTNNSARIQLIAICTLLTLAGLLSMTQTASAVLLNIDFNAGYSPGDLNSQNPAGDGLSAWSGSTAVDIVSGDLVPTVVPNNYAGQTGTAQRAAGQLLTATEQNVNASLDSPMTSNDLWFSYLLNRGSTGARGGIDLFGAGGQVRVIGVGGDLRLIGPVTATLSSALTVGTTHFILGQVIVNDAGNETINLWLDPADLDSLGGVSLTGSGDFISATGLLSLDIESYGSDGSGAVDFVVFAESKAELLSFITPPPVVPEPSSLLLLGLGALGLARHARRRRRRA